MEVLEVYLGCWTRVNCMRELLWTLELDVDTFRWLYQAEPVTIARYGTQGVMLFDHLTHDFAALFPREGVERLYSLDEVSYPLDVVTDECLADADLTSVLRLPQG